MTILSSMDLKLRAKWQHVTHGFPIRRFLYVALLRLDLTLLKYIPAICSVFHARNAREVGSVRGGVQKFSRVQGTSVLPGIGSSYYGPPLFG